MMIHRLVGWGVVIGGSLLAAGCASEPSMAAGSTPADSSAAALAGTWTMDLSPQQDRSYEKTMVIVAPQEGAKRGHSFTGSVYDGSAFDNGLVFVDRGILTFSMVSDESKQLGGPYYWLGTLQADGTLRGRVQTLSRGFELAWSARRAAPAK